MKTLTKTLCMLVACACMCMPSIEAQNRGRNNGGGGEPSRTQAPQRQHNNNRPGNQGNSRPGNQGNSRPDYGRRPGNTQPRPTVPGHQRPNPGGPRPTGPSYGPGHGYRPGPVPGFGHIHFGAPHRPMLPPPAPFHRPVPPPHFVAHGPSLFSTILGVALGTALNVSLGNLVRDGYTVSAYGNDAIYLSNVRQLNMIWPNATMYYNNGYLSASEFVYSTSYFDIYRYNQAYAMLVNSYGAPIQAQSLGGGGMSSTWWGPSGQFVTLRYTTQTAYNGTVRYYTTLSFGM